MEINLHVCLPELGLTASLAVLGLCETSADLDRFRPSSSFSDWQQCNRGSTETTMFSAAQADFTVFATFCTSTKRWFYLSIFIPSTNFCSLRERKKTKPNQQTNKQTKQNKKTTERKLAFTLLSHRSGTKLFNRYTLHCHIFGEEETSLLGDIILQCKDQAASQMEVLHSQPHADWSNLL